MKILLLEDDELLHDSIKAYLELENFKITSAYCSDDIYTLTYSLSQNDKYDLYIFDINVPGDDGIEILKSLRFAEDKTPTIYITALNDINMLTKGFEAGADDYIKKPFDIIELVVRIKSKYIKKDIIRYEDIAYDVTNKIIKIDEKVIHLSATLFNLFHILIINKNNIVSYDTMLEFIENQSMNALKSNITKLKSKLNLKITSIRSIGYKLEEL